MKQTRNRARIGARSIAIAALVGLATILAFSVPVSAAPPNRGTIKVHDDEVVDPPTKNQPHVSCDFWIEGFNMERDEGTLVFQAWPPTGNKEVVTPTGDDLTWEADSDGHFLNGAYQLPEGHYKVTAKSVDSKDKSKVFWVDECNGETTSPPTTSPPTTSPPPSTEIPFFPSAGALALGTIGALGSAFVVMRRK